MSESNQNKIVLINNPELEQRASAVQTLVSKLLETNAVLSSSELKSITDKKLAYMPQSKDRKIGAETSRLRDKHKKYMINLFFNASAHCEDLKEYDQALSKSINFINEKGYRNSVNKVSNKNSRRQEKARSEKLAIEGRKTEFAQFFLKDLVDAKEVFKDEASSSNKKAKNLTAYIEKYYMQDEEVQKISSFAGALTASFSERSAANKGAEVSSLGEVYNLFAIMVTNEADRLEEDVESYVDMAAHFIFYVNARKQEAVKKQGKSFDVNSFITDKGIDIYVEPLEKLSKNIVFDYTSHVILSTEIAAMDKDSLDYWDIIPEIINP